MIFYNLIFILDILILYIVGIPYTIFYTCIYYGLVFTVHNSNIFIVIYILISYTCTYTI